MTVRDLIEDIKKPRPDLLIAIVIAVVLLGVAYWLPLHQANLATRGLTDANHKEYFEIANKARVTVLQGFTGASFFVTAFVALKNLRVAEDNRKIAEDRQATDLFVKAAEMLGNESLEVRLAGIYSLERIARNFPNDRVPVMELLAAFVRMRPHSNEEKASQIDNVFFGSCLPDPAPTDVSAALKVIVEVNSTERLKDLILDRGNLGEVTFEEQANFQGAILNRSNLCYAKLPDAIFRDARLFEADLRLSLLSNADFTGANLPFADLRRAELKGTIFKGANIECASFYSAKCIEPKQIMEANNWQYAFYDPEFVIKLAKHGSCDQKFVEQLECMASENPKYTSP